MGPDEFSKTMAKYGVEYNKRTLFNHTAAGCLPEPKRGAGYGGKWAEYKDIDVVWAITAWRMIHGLLSEKDTNALTKSSISEMKPPRFSPKITGLIHKEVLKSFREYVQSNNINDTEIFERFLCEQSFKNLFGPIGIAMRNGVGWYVFTLDGVINDMASIDCVGNADDGEQDANGTHVARFMVEHLRLWERLVESVREVKAPKG